MKIQCDGFGMQIIRQDESENYFNLIEKNRHELLEYFPRTCDAVQDLEGAKKNLMAFLESHDRKGIYPFGIYIKEELVGWISIKNLDWHVLKGELGYFVDKDHQGKRIITKAIKALESYAFNELGLEKLFIRTGPGNIGSNKVAHNNGFVKEGVLRNEFRMGDGTLESTVYYGKLKGGSDYSM